MSKISPPSLTRREFVVRLGQFSGGALTGLTAMGLMSRNSGIGAPLNNLPSLPTGRKVTVAIMGAGIAGLTAAYELEKLGFSCTVLEPRKKAGGRCITLRGGDVVEETTGVKQTCNFEDGFYFNPGPSRFPQWHVTMDYCRELGVEIEPFISMNENAYYYTENTQGSLSGKRIRIREAKTDLRGYTAELLAKVVEQDKLDQPLTREDKERLLEYLRFEGGLGSDSTYRGHSRRGYEIWPGGGLQEGQLGEVNKLDELLQAGFSQYFHRANEYQYQSQMFTVRGGMDKLALALYKKVSGSVIMGAAVKEFRHSRPGCRVVYTKDGQDVTLEADYGICTIPPPVLRRIPNDFSMPLKNTLNIVPFQNSGKIALQFKSRFWEEKDRIYGGLSWTNLPIGELWYQNDHFFSRKGMINGYYIFGPQADAVGRMTPAERTEFALSNGEKIHPEYREQFDSSLSFNWSTEPWLEGCLAHFPRAMIKTFYPLLVKPEQETYIAASWASHLGGWQAGAFEGARLAVKDIHTRSMAGAQ